MSLNTQLQLQVEDILKAKVNNFQPTSGGCINHSGIIETIKGAFFIKRNDAKRFPQMFEKEAKGLQLLETTKAIRIPKVIHYGIVENEQFLILENIKSGRKGFDFERKFGQQLATLHKNTNTQYGLDHSNYIGSLPQFNHFTSDWTAFFIENRIEPQLKIARDSQLIDRKIVASFEKMYRRLDEIFPKEAPALVHGDLWNGNSMIDETGQPVLIDPAIAYSYREMDIAMSKLFGGFSDVFYESYYEHFSSEAPKETDFRLSICNLYYLMVHVNLFGVSYLSSVKNTLKSFK